MKIGIEELDGKVIAVNDGVRSVSIVESVSALDFHLAKHAIRNFTEMLNRHSAQTNTTEGGTHYGTT